MSINRLEDLEFDTLSVIKDLTDGTLFRNSKSDLLLEIHHATRTYERVVSAIEGARKVLDDIREYKSS